jgi:hypothetical protein
MHPIERLRAVARARGLDQRVLAREAAMVLGVLADDPLGLVMSCRRLLDRHPGAGSLWWACARLLDSPDARAEAWEVARELGDDELRRALALDVPERSSVIVVSDPAGGSELADRLAAQRDDLVVIETDDPPFDVPAMIEAATSLNPGDVGPAGAVPGRTPISDPPPDLPGLAELDGLADLSPSADRLAHVYDRHDEPGSGPTIVAIEVGAVGPDAALVTPGTAAAIDESRRRGVPVWLVVGLGRRLPGPLFDAAVRLAPDVDVLPVAAVDRVVEPRRSPCPAPPELLRPWTA